MFFPLRSVLVGTLALMPLCFCDIVRDVKGSIIDLTHSFDETTLYYNGKTEFKLTSLFKIREKDYTVDQNAIQTVEHGGTHIDAPSHFVVGGANVGDIILDKMIGPAAVLRLSHKVKINPLYQVTIEDITEWESKHGHLSEKAILMLEFNWTKRWPNLNQFFGTSNPDDGPSRAYPGLHKDAALWLAKNRPYINAVATEACSIDYGITADYSTHTTLLKNNIVVFENVKDIARVPNFATVFGIPMKIKKGTGAPLRIFAILPNNDKETFFSFNPYFLTVIYVVSLIFVLFYRRN